MNVHLADDPNRAWARIKPHVSHVVQAYAACADEAPGSHSPFRGLADVDPLRAAGLFAVWTPDELAAHARTMDPLGSISMAPLIGGLDPEEGWRSLRLLERVMPRLATIGEAA